MQIESQEKEFQHKKAQDSDTPERTDIIGWGIDADPKNDPTYPLKKRTDAEKRGYTWPRPPLQPVNIEVLHSNERPNITAVFGTSVPPSGISGSIRRWAFQYSEGTFAHWMALILADRIQEVEGIGEDLQKGKIPNIFAERGIKAQWKYDRANLIKKAAISIGVTSALLYMSFGRSRK